MSKLLRPYIPLEVRLQVALRQIYSSSPTRFAPTAGAPVGVKLKECLGYLFGDEDYHLDHDPALENREKVFTLKLSPNGRNGAHVHTGYSPDANDPGYLVYRLKDDHDIKTRVRGEHGQFADNVLAKRERRRLKKLSGKRRKYKWPKGRKIQSRNNLRRRPK